MNRSQYTYVAAGGAIHDGSKGFEFWGTTTATYNPQYLISPELDGTQGVAYTFYYKSYNNVTHQFQLGYSTTSDLTSDAWVWSDTKTSNGDWMQLDEQVCPAGTKYVAVKYLSTSGYFFIDDFTFSLPPEINAPTDLTVTAVSTTSATLTWNGENGYTYNVGYKAAADADWTSHTGLSATTTEITGLTAGTSYQVRVQSAFKGQTSGWTSTNFITECEAASLPYTYGFEDSESSKWNCWEKGTGLSIASGYAVHEDAKGLEFNNANGQTFTSPELEGTENGVAFYFYYGVYSGTQTFQVGYFNGTDWTWTDNIQASNVTNTGWLQYVKEDIPAGTTQVAIKCTSSGYFFVDDISITEAPSCLMPTSLQVTDIMPNSATLTWEGTADNYDIEVNGTMTEGITGTSYLLENLELNTAYIVKVRSNCGGGNYSEWTDEKSFTTLNKAFVTEGDWNVASHWLPAVVPSADENVDIMAPATINNGTVAYANQITYGANGSITIKDGGQLKHATSGLQVVVEKDIKAWTVENGKPDGYYFISKPLSTAIANNEYSTKVPGMLDNNKYDYYLFNANGSGGLEWRNYRAGEFGMSAFNGYLYANQENVTLKFTGAAYMSGNNAAYNFTYNYTYDATSELSFNGWTLIGNPYTANCYLSYNGESYDFYVMNENGNDFVVVSRALKPCEGAFFHYESSGKLTWSPVEPETSSSPVLEMTVSQNRGRVDNARVRFGNAKQLPKLSFREGSTKLYIPQGGKDYAVVRSEGEGELPVNFKAEKNGTYTLSFNMEDVEFNHLHLIDNMTGADIDLLATPSYTFQSRTSDYASRFRLVFSTTGVEENDAEANANFAYFNGSEWVVNASDNATLEVIDMTGRTVAHGTRTIATNGMAQGVYVLRLVDNNSVKTQKIVVR